MKVKVVPLSKGVPLPGGDGDLPRKGAVVELTAYWSRLAEAGDVRITAAPDDGGGEGKKKKRRK